jgi:excisionase family DNA binding protein
MDENYFTVSQVAEKLKVKDSTIWRWIRLGKLNCVRIGRNYRISQTDIDKFLKQEK